MLVPPITQAIHHVVAVRRRGRQAMVLLFTAGTVGAVTRVAAPWITIGLVAGVLVFACLAVCVLTAIVDERAWRGVRYELGQLRPEGGRHP